MLSAEEQSRYNRQILLPDFGIAAQERLKAGGIAVIGAGGLGSPALYYLAAAGVGRIGIIDGDVVEESNLQRQVLFTTEDLGKPKSITAAARIAKLNPGIQVATHQCRLDASNALDILSGYDVIIDGSDNLPTRYLANDAAVLLEKTLIYGAVFQFEGQASVFNQPTGGRRGPNYRDIFPEPPPPEMVPSCSEAGVLGVLPGVIGTVQATEAIKVLTGVGKTLSGRLMIYDALDATTRYLSLHHDPANPLSGDHPTIRSLMDYEAFCQGSVADAKQIEPEEVSRWMASGKRFQIVDVREPSEFLEINIGGMNIPLRELPSHVAEIDKQIPVVVLCRSGLRSQRAIHQLTKDYGFSNLLNLKNGLLGWKMEVNKGLKV